jgi:SAM-dependent methyltransferase
MWKCIRQTHNFREEYVVDFGCGHGDMCLNVLRDGARNVVGVDNHFKMIDATEERCNNDQRLTTWLLDINSYDFYDPIWADSRVAFCFSVLPHLREQRGFCEYLSKTFHETFLEVQYFGDGPGLEMWKDNDDFMRFLLDAGFSTATKIGKTLVEGRNTWRTIWKCAGRY